MVFKSKQNRVYRCRDVVIKQHPGVEGAVAEAVNLRRLREAGVLVPEVLERRGNELVLAYIPGETIPDFLARMEGTPRPGLMVEAADGLCTWFERFYRAVGYPKSGEIRGDVNGRNFILSPTSPSARRSEQAGGISVVGVDFQERAFGAAEQDIGRLLAYVRTYDPPHTQVKRLFARLLWQAVLERLNLSPMEIRGHYRRERGAMGKRRGVPGRSLRK